MHLIRQGPCLSIRIVIWILPSDTLFGDDLYCICFDHPNRETAMLSTPYYLQSMAVLLSSNISIEQHFIQTNLSKWSWTWKYIYIL